MRHQARLVVGALVAVVSVLFVDTSAASADKGSGSSGSGGSGSGGSGSGGSGATGDKQPIFDFSDAFYRANGIDPAGLVGRRSGSDGLSVTAPAPDANHRNVRVTFVLPAYDTSGGLRYFTVLADLAPTAFLNNPAGATARQIADANTVWVFPTRTGNQTAVNNNRQADMVDLSGGYFSNDPLGLWVHVFVSWTNKIDTTAGRARLADLARKNGLALDGTPIIKAKSEIDALAKDGYVTLLRRGTNEVGRYFVCPVYKDPTNGAITRDAFLATVRRADGTPLPAEQGFVTSFQSLQSTGRWP